MQWHQVRSPNWYAEASLQRLLKAALFEKSAISRCALAMPSALRDRDYLGLADLLVDIIAALPQAAADSASMASRGLTSNGRGGSTSSVTGTAQQSQQQCQQQYRSYLFAMLTLALERLVGTVACNLHAGDGSASADLVLTLRETRRRDHPPAVLVVQVAFPEAEGERSLSSQLAQGQAYFERVHASSTGKPEGAVIVVVAQSSSTGFESEGGPPSSKLAVTVWDKGCRKWQPLSQPASECA